jgi:hypothetical protein
MRRLDGLPTVAKGSPRESLIDEDILYCMLGCLLCQKDRQFIFCALETYNGLGYACLECGAEQPTWGQIMKKNGHIRKKRSGRKPWPVES